MRLQHALKFLCRMRVFRTFPGTENMAIRERPGQLVRRQAVREDPARTVCGISSGYDATRGRLCATWHARPCVPRGSSFQEVVHVFRWFIAKLNLSLA